MNNIMSVPRVGAPAELINKVARRMVLLGDAEGIIEPGHVMSIGQFEAAVRDHLREDYALLLEKSGRPAEFSRKYRKYIED